MAQRPCALRGEIGLAPPDQADHDALNLEAHGRNQVRVPGVFGGQARLAPDQDVPLKAHLPPGFWA